MYPSKTVYTAANIPKKMKLLPTQTQTHAPIPTPDKTKTTPSTETENELIKSLAPFLFEKHDYDKLIDEETRHYEYRKANNSLVPMSPEVAAEYYSFFPDAVPYQDTNTYSNSDKPRYPEHQSSSSYLNNNRNYAAMISQLDPPPPSQHDPTHFPTYEEFLQIAKEGGITFPQNSDGTGSMYSGDFPSQADAQTQTHSYSPSKNHPSPSASSSSKYPPPHNDSGSIGRAAKAPNPGSFHNFPHNMMK